MLDKLTNQRDESQSPGEEGAAGIPFDFDPQLLSTVHVFTSPGRFSLMTDEEFRKKQQAHNQNTNPTPPETQEAPTAKPQREPPHFLYVILIFVFFLLFDMGDSYSSSLLAPTVTITIQPNSQSITVKSAATLGKFLSPITLSQSQTVPTTGHGHQDARASWGSVTFYNGSNTPQSIGAGTVFTGQDGVQGATDATVTIAANNPPNDGEAHVSAHTVHPGRNGNIQAYDINLAVSSDLTVKNLASFTGGQDARDFKIVTQADRDMTAATLKEKVSSSMTAALEGQLTPGEQLQPTPCTPTTTTDHAIGQEATQVTVTVSQTCTAIAYDTKTLTDQAQHVLTTQATKKLGQGYLLSGDMKVTVTRAATQNKTVVLSFTCQGTYIYQLNAPLQQGIKNLVAGKPRLAASRLLLHLVGIQHASISGIPDNEFLPTDTTHIHLSIFYLVS